MLSNVADVRKALDQRIERLDTEIGAASRERARLHRVVKIFTACVAEAVKGSGACLVELRDPDYDGLDHLVSELVKLGMAVEERVGVLAVRWGGGVSGEGGETAVG